MGRHETRILARDQGGGKTEISVLDPKSGKEIRTGLTGKSAEETDRLVRTFKENLERAGNRVSYREVDRRD
jgi:hypothetical protein